ncbi:MAG: class I SAM-dependent methyltransferase [Alphaproteobacteria bacterium]|nr:class I SAM-dependent methyltransferase [Alphaproteobacteria bacterium]
MQTRDHGATMAYISRIFVREPEYLAAARAEGERRRPGMQISPYEGHLLQWLVRVSGAGNILEIGTFMGTSALWMAGGLPEGGHITSLEFEAEHAALAAAHSAASPHAARITVVQADAHAWLAQTPPSPQWDLVFIDAEKKGYADYLEAVLPRLRPRGWIIGDNTLLFGALSGENPRAASTAAKTSMQRFNETLADPARFEAVLLPTAEGLTVARLR